MTFKSRRSLKRTKIEIIPMIDTMFFLLVFFMLSSLSLTNLLVMPVNLPQASNSIKQSNLGFTVSIDKSEQVYINKRLIPLAEVGQTLASLAGPTADMSKDSVVINADEGVPYGLVIRCIDEARGVGVTHFPLATAPDSSKGG